MAASKNIEGANSPQRPTDLHTSGRVNTKVETQTEVVDNTSAPASRSSIEYESRSEEITPGTTLVTYMEPRGGFPKSDAEDA